MSSAGARELTFGVGGGYGLAEKPYHFFTVFDFFMVKQTQAVKLHHVPAVLLQLVEGQGSGFAKRCFWCRNGAETVQFSGVVNRPREGTPKERRKQQG